MEHLKDVSRVVQSILEGGVVKATKFISPKLVIRATRTKTSFGRGRNMEMTLTIGKPNYVEREIIRDHVKAGVQFPIKGILIKLTKQNGKKNI